jgi:hypothetical protein
MVGAIVHARQYREVVIDDSFITFRHASNLVHGHGFTCTPGQRVEGTSSPLFGLLIAIPVALSFDPYAFACWISTAAFTACVAIAYVAVRTWLDGPGSRGLGLGAAVLVASSPVLAFHSQTGLETLTYACVLSLAFCLQLAALKRSYPSPNWARAMGVAALLRPEGFAVFLLLLGLGQVARLRQNRGWSDTPRELVAFGSLWIPWVLFRLVYYRTWWPNTVLAKSGHIQWAKGIWPAMLDTVVHGAGTELLWSFIAENPVPCALLLGATALPRVRIPIVTAGAVTLSYAAVATWNGGDWMLHYRLLTACVTPLFVGATLGLRAFLFQPEQRGFKHMPSQFLAAAIIGSVVFGNRRLPVTDDAIKDLPRIREVGLRLASVRRPDDRVVTASAGILPFYWGAPAIDMFGLCDRHIAEVGTPLPLGLGRSDPAYLVAQSPTFYAFEYVVPAVDFFRSLEFAKERDKYYLVQYPANYLATKTFNAPVLFVRKDRPEVERVAKALGARLVDAERELRRLGFLEDRPLAY